MQELVGRLTSLDPSASETVKVISYFDTLIVGSAGVHALVRAAATLSGTIAGYAEGDRTVRFSAAGDLCADDDALVGRWPTIDVSSSERVWIERSGAAHANDAMILERFAFAIGVLGTRRGGDRDDAVQVAIDSARTASERAAAVNRLRLPAGPIRALASSPHSTVSGPHTMVVTEFGLLRATLVDAPRTLSGGDRVGWGTWGDSSHLPTSWDDALLAWRLSTSTHPAVDAEELGLLRDVLRAASSEGAASHKDVVGLRSLSSAALRALDALVGADSVRAAAANLGVHHSTLQARYATLILELGYDPRSPRGRARFEMARMLMSLSPPY